MGNPYKLSELAIILGGGTPKTTNPNYWNGNIPWLSVVDFNNDYRHVFVSEKYITEDGLNNSSTQILFPGDVIISARGTVGALAQVAREMAFNQSCYGLRAKQDIVTQDYLYYILKNTLVLLKKQTHGSVFDTITRDSFKSVTVDVPSLAEQKRIARILSSLDDKIEVNNQINRNLEEQAQILLEQISQNKQIIKLGDILSFVNGFAFKSGTYISNGIYKIITIKNVQDGKIDSEGAETISVIPQKMKQDCILHDGDVLLSLTGNVGRVGIVCEDNLLLNQRVAKIVAHDPNLNAAAYFIMRRNATKTLLVSISRGTAQANLSPVESLNVGVPFNIESIQRLAPVINCLFRQIVKNEKENQRLSAIRDTLLPKLMSGEIAI